MKSKLTLTFSCLASLMLVASTASAVTFAEIARFDVASSADSAGANYIGNNPSAVAWSGQQLYIAGFNSSGVNANTAIVEVTNATSTGLQTGTLSPAFGVLTTPNSRGYSGLDIQGGVLAAAYDDGAADPNGIQAFNTGTNSQSWAKSARGGSGVAFDPGFPGGDAAVGSGVAWTTFGSGRRALQNTSTGADIWTTANGMIWVSAAPPDNFARDMDFDPDTGDIYVRRSNNIDAAIRTGDNSATGNAVLVDEPDGPFVAGQNLSFLSNTLFGDLLVYNNRPTTGAAAFADVVKVIDPTGAALAASFSFLGGAAPTDGNGYYDFDFDAATQTLAIADFANRNVHIFKVVPEPTSMMLVLLGASALLVRRWR